MSDRHLSEAADAIELVRLMQRRLSRDQQPREQMRDELKFAKAKINIKLDEMERVDSMHGDENAE